MRILKELVKYSGRAVKKFRTTSRKKFLAWIDHVITKGRIPMDAPPFQGAIYEMVTSIMTGCPESFFVSLMSHKIAMKLFLRLRDIAPTAIVPLCKALEACVEEAKTYGYGRQQEFDVVFRMGNQIACDRLLTFDNDKGADQRRQRDREYGIWYICDISASFACLFIALSLNLRIQTPIEAREHLRILSRGYNPWTESTDPSEQERWHDLSMCYMVGHTDYSTDEGQTVGQNEGLLMVNDFKKMMLEEKRSSSIRCGSCHKTEECEEEKPLKRCLGCKLVFYCDSKCQKNHWRLGGHGKICRKQVKVSIPESLLSMEESVNRLVLSVTGRNTGYQIMFAIWLENS